MEKAILWDEHLNEQFVKVSNEKLNLFLELLSYIGDNNISNTMSLDLYDNSDLWEWLTSKEPSSLRDIKKELLIKISKTKRVLRQEYINIVANVGNLNKDKILILEFSNKSVYYISTMDEYYIGLRSYLAMEKKDDFCKDMLECFPNIWFDENIASSINSLNRDFEELREEIVEHLTKINDYHSKFTYLLSQSKSNQDISQAFHAETGIECSPQAGREGVQVLKMSCFNELSKQTEVVKCELHTKFKRFNIDRTKQDRIYFFPGKPGIKQGKIIVKHIGKHL